MTPLIFPLPKPDIQRYPAKLERGFKRFPDRKHNYDLFQQASRETTGLFLPVKMDVENINQCNLQCPMCQVPNLKSFQKGQELSFSFFQQLLDEQYGVVELKLQGMGEPFLGKSFLAMADYASAKDIWIRTSTNATLLHINEAYKKAIDSGLDEIQISMDGTSKEVYEAIRRGASYERTVQNCQLINEYCRSQKVDKTKMWVLLQKANFHQLPLFPRFARELGFQRMAIILDLHGWADVKMIAKNQPHQVSEGISQELVDRLVAEATALGLELGFWGISAKYSQANLCPWPFERTFIASTKEVVPCCMIGNPHTFSLGRITDGFSKIWRSEAYQAFRQAHLSGNIPSVCRNCYSEMR
jgi:pyrroloquinoline quinone biosynthesis protein E